MQKVLPPARFEGIVIYQDPDGVFEVRYPLNWHKFEVTQQRGGILFSPYQDHQAAWVAAWKEYLSRGVQAEDLETLRQGLNEGISLLGDEVEILHQSEDVIENLLRLERILTFKRDGVAHQRRQWLFYAHKTQINLVYQAHQDEYQHWSGMAYYAFHTFRLPDHLWFAAEAAQQLFFDPIGKETDHKRRKRSKS